MPNLPPATPVPVWDTSVSNINVPPGGAQASGWTVDQIPPSGWFNWFMNLWSNWLAWLSTLDWLGSTPTAPLLKLTGAAGVGAGGGIALTITGGSDAAASQAGGNAATVQGGNGGAGGFGGHGLFARGGSSTGGTPGSGVFGQASGTSGPGVQGNSTNGQDAVKADAHTGTGFAVEALGNGSASAVKVVGIGGAKGVESVVTGGGDGVNTTTDTGAAINAIASALTGIPAIFAPFNSSAAGSRGNIQLIENTGVPANPQPGELSVHNSGAGLHLYFCLTANNWTLVV